MKRSTSVFVCVAIISGLVSYFIFHLSMMIVLSAWVIVILIVFAAAKYREKHGAPSENGSQLAILALLTSASLLICFGENPLNGVYKLHAHRIANDVYSAVDTLQKSPPGIARANDFVNRLKAIDTSCAPDELKKALHDYIVAAEGILRSYESSNVLAATNTSMEVEKLKLITAIRKWN